MTQRSMQALAERVMANASRRRNMRSICSAAVNLTGWLQAAGRSAALAAFAAERLMRDATLKREDLVITAPSAAYTGESHRFCAERGGRFSGADVFPSRRRHFLTSWVDGHFCQRSLFRFFEAAAFLSPHDFSVQMSSF